MLFNLTTLSEKPLHTQIAQQLIEKILLDDFYDGCELPRVRQLASEQHISVHSLEKAYSVLAEEGLIIANCEGRFFVPEFSLAEKQIFRRRFLGNGFGNLDFNAIEQELSMAHQMQTHLLPRSLPDCKEFSVAAHYEPAKTVSGDFYDYLPFDEGRFGLVIADACGKGLPAAMLAAQIQALMKNEVQKGIPIDRILANMNQQLIQFTPRDKFVTLFYGVFATKSRVFEYTAAGHNCPVIIQQDGSCRYLQVSGPGLGIIERAVYKTGSVTMNAGDTLFLYTDGITETMDAEREEYGEARLLNFLVQNRDSCPQELLAAVLEDINRFNGGLFATDDRTMLALKLNSGDK